MKKLALCILLFCTAMTWAAPPPNPADYAVKVHVASAHLVTRLSGGVIATNRFRSEYETYLVLDVLIDGKKYELTSGWGSGVIPVGDYTAKIVPFKKQPKQAYQFAQSYELLFPDGTVTQFEITGSSE